jgi:filamentous hemagglutinin family protein
MANVRRISRKYYLRQITACFLVWCMMFVIPARVAMADIGTGGWDVVQGSADITAPGGGADALIQMLSDRAVINWQDFDTDVGQLVQFLKESGNFAVLNRIIGEGGATQFNGILQALAGDVFIVNTRGVVFGPQSYVQARNFVASGIDIKNENFMNGIHQFEAFPATEGHPYSDLIGDVTNEGIGIENGIHAENIALIGKNVTNRGLISAPGGTVILAAGESVLLSDVGSNVVVEVAMPEQIPSRYDYKVRHEGEGSIEAKNVILAAGDVWSMAYISANSGPGSDAVATVDISAEGNVQITDDIEAEAVGNGTDDAIAAVTINAGGSVDVKSDGCDSTTIKAKAVDGANNYADVVITAGDDVTVSARDDDVKIKAEAYSDEYDGVLNQANIELTGKNVTVQSEDSGGIFDVFSPDDALVYAYAHDGAQNKANITLTATAKDVMEDDTVVGTDGGNVLLQSEGQKGDDVLVKAEAKNGSNNTASIGIDADADVSVLAYGIFDEVLVQAEAWNELEREPVIPEPEVVTEIIDGEEVEVEQEVVVDLAVEGLTNTATVDITAGGSVDVVGEESGDAAVQALAHNDIDVDIDNYDNEVTVNLTVADLENNAGVTINAAGDVEAGAYGSSSIVGISAEAYNELELDQHTGGKYWVQDGCCWWQGHWEYYESYPAALNLDVTGLDNTANVEIAAASGNVEVGTIEGFLFDSEAIINADAWNDLEIDLYEGSTGNLTLDGLANNANIDITAGGDVMVTAENGGESGIIASAWNELDADDDASGDITSDNIENNAGVTIDADGSVKVKADCHRDCSEAYIYAQAWNEDVVEKPESEDDIPGNMKNTANVDIAAGGDVKVMAFDCGEAYIIADTWLGTDNTAGVTITTEDGDVLVLGKDGDASIESIATEGIDNTATVAIDAVGGDVKVIAKGGSEAEIEAIAKEGGTNTADVLICIEGNLKVEGDCGGEAEIEALAKSGNSNSASVGIGAKGERGVEVTAKYDGEAGISSKAKDGYTNTASTIVCTQGGVDVIATRGGDAEILAQAKQGHITDAYVGIGAMGNVVVRAGQEQIPACDAGIRAEAESMGCPNPESTADAEVVVFTHEGSVEVKAYGGLAEVLADAQGGHKNIAKVGVAAAADLPPQYPVIPVYTESISLIDNFEILPLTGNVLVEAFGEDAEAQILAWAHDARSIYEYPEIPAGQEITSEPIIIPGENTADTVVCAPGWVKVYSYSGQGSEARIKSRAGWWGDEESINKATTQVYASDVKVNVSSLRHGQGIWAYAVGAEDNPHTPAYYCMTEDGEVAVTDGAAILFIKDYSKRKDCPTCPPCPCEEGVPLMPPAPIYEEELGKGGCPTLMAWLANEVGVPAENIQVFVTNALAGSPGIQPCDMCARLVNASVIMQDPAGTRIAALTQVLNEFVTTPAPPSPEQMTSIAAAFAEHVNDGTFYASAGEWIDALVAYVTILNTEMGFSTADSVAFAQKYLTPVTEAGNVTLTAYVQARLAALGG